MSPPSLYAAIAGSVFLTALGGLTVAGRGREVTYSLPKAAAVEAATRDPGVRRNLDHFGPVDRARVTPLDAELQRVSFFRGRELILDVAVTPQATVRSQSVHPPNQLSTASPVASAIPVVALLACVFALASGARPLRRLRNLDVLMLLSFLVPIGLLARRLVDASVVASLPPLLYLGARCLWVGLAKRSPGLDPPARSSRPIRGPKERARILRLAVGAAALVLCMVTVFSPRISDVAMASLAGATLLARGLLPYGRMPDFIVHGDTYPPLNYLAHLPAALVSPVDDLFDDIDGALYVAAMSALVAAVALYAAGRQRGGSQEDGLKLALAWLTFPPILIVASGGSNDMLLAVCVALALAWTAHAGRSSLILAVGMGIKLIPLAVLPLWLARFRGAAAARALLATAAVCAATLVGVIALGGGGGIGAMLDALSFQMQRGSLLSLWSLIGVGRLHIAFQAAAVAGIAVLIVHVARHRALACDPRRVAALVGAVMIALQLAANYWTFAYIPWLFPALALALLCEPRAAASR